MLFNFVQKLFASLSVFEWEFLLWKLNFELQDFVAFLLLPELEADYRGGFAVLKVVGTFRLLFQLFLIRFNHDRLTLWNHSGRRRTVAGRFWGRSRIPGPSAWLSFMGLVPPLSALDIRFFSFSLSTVDEEARGSCVYAGSLKLANRSLFLDLIQPRLRYFINTHRSWVSNFVWCYYCCAAAPESHWTIIAFTFSERSQLASWLTWCSWLGVLLLLLRKLPTTLSAYSFSYW